MARKAPTSTEAASVSLTLSQQAVNALRQMVNAIGWAKSIEDILYGGQLLSTGLPKLESTDWVRTAEEQAKFTSAERKAYIVQDAAWGSKELTFGLTPSQQDAAVKAFRHWVDEAAKNGRLAPAEWLTELIQVLGVTPAVEQS